MQRPAARRRMKDETVRSIACLLAQLRPGESGTVTRVDGDAETRHRLLEMGLTRGTPIRLVRFAPLGDPIELHVRGYRLTLRRREAAPILVAAQRSPVVSTP